jgi:glucose-fructose oxidoreductase
MTALGVHPVDTFQYWAGPATRVSAFSSKVAGFSGLDETTTVMLEYGGGVLGTIGTSYFTPPVVSVAAHGTELSAWNEQDGDRLFVQPRSERTRTEQDVVPIDTIADEMEEFARCVREGVRPETGAEEGIEVAAVIEAVVLSAESGRSIDLDELR